MTTKSALYMVTRRPRAQYASAYAVVYWFTWAANKTGAVRKAVDLLPRDFGDASSIYAKPTAEVAFPGGLARYL